MGMLVLFVAFSGGNSGEQTEMAGYTEELHYDALISEGNLVKYYVNNMVEIVIKTVPKTSLNSSIGF
jgi:hypothetical protein